MNRPNRTVEGFDVHKGNVFLCIIDNSGKIFEHKYVTPNLVQMTNDMQKYGVTELTIESTGIYWIPIWRVLEDYPKQFERLQKIPGVKERSATFIIAEVGVDMKMFATVSALVSWYGLRPRNEESAGRRIVHGNKYLRTILIE